MPGVGDMLGKLSPGPFAGAQRGQMLGVLLAVDRSDLMRVAEGHQGGECNFGRIGFVGKHGLPKYRLTYRDTVQATHQLGASPGLHTVGESLSM